MRRGVLGYVGQCLGGDVVGADLDRLRQPLVSIYPQVDGGGGAAGECLEGGAETARAQLAGFGPGGRLRRAQVQG
jgi:hypothetical protein